MLSTTLRNALRLNAGQHWRLAQRIGVHPTTLSRWLNGAVPPKAGDERVVALGAALGVPPQDCFESDANTVGASAA